MSDIAETGPGLAPAVFDLGSIRLTKLSVGPHDNNAYVVTDVASNSSLLVDAAADPSALLAAVSGTTLVGILTTHQHGDHWGALADVYAATKVPTYAHGADADVLPVRPDALLRDTDMLPIGADTHLEIRHVPGHTPGSVIVIVRGSQGPVHILTGDALFPGGVGNTWGNKENFELLLAGVIREVFDRFPDDTVIDPGHGKSTTIGAERPSLGEWAARGW